MKKALVISGGGSKGAFAGGVAEYLIQKAQNKYDLFLGTSTGSLLITHLALGKIDELKALFTSVDQHAIFNINPFKIKNVNGVNVVSIRHSNTLLNFIKGSKTFGQSKNLKKLICNNVTKTMYDTVCEGSKDIVVTVSNLTANRIEYKSIKECAYEDFCDWTFASCSAYPFMEPVVKNGMQYIDGATLEAVPIQEAINRGATDIDVIILKEENPKFEAEYLRNLSQGILSVLDLMQSELGNDDVQIGKLKAINSDEEIRLNLYYTPRKLTNNSLVFDKELMNGWWDEGYKYAEEVTCKKYSLIKGRKAKLIKD